MTFTIEFFRIRERDNADATLDRITHIAPDLDSAKAKARSLFETLNLPQTPMVYGFWTNMDTRCFFGNRDRQLLEKDDNRAHDPALAVSVQPFVAVQFDNHS